MISNLLNEFIRSCIDDFSRISSKRKETLSRLTSFIEERLEQDWINLIFICSHNSRRSQISQIWAQVAARYYGLNQVHCYSGGTEVTALYPVVVETLELQGLSIQLLSTLQNPVYSAKYDENSPSIIGYSKLYDDAFNPQSNFGAIMVCSSADANCPFIPTAAERLLLPFEDPKEFDGTPVQKGQYFERSAQIATELMYAFSQVKK